MHGTACATAQAETNISTIHPSKTMLQVSAKLFSPRVFCEIHLLQMNCDKRSISGSLHRTRLQITMTPVRNDSRQRACGLSTERTSSAGRATSTPSSGSMEFVCPIDILFMVVSDTVGPFTTAGSGKSVLWYVALNTTTHTELLIL